MTLQVAVIPVTPFEQNCSLVWDSATMQGAVVDPGGDVPQLLAAIKQAGIKVTDIFLTHGHIDHAGGAADLAAALGVRITGPGVADKFLLEGMAEQGKMFGFEAKNCTPDAWLKDGDKVKMGSGEFEVRACPGHTPGHVVFLNLTANFGMVGDVLFRNSVGRTDFPYGNTQQLMTSIETKLLVLPDDFAFISGHGVNSTIGAEKRSNPFIR